MNPSQETYSIRMSGSIVVVLCRDRHYVEIIFSYGADYRKNRLGFAEHRIDMWAATPGWFEVAVIPVHGCPSGGGGGGGGGCEDIPVQDDFLLIFLLLSFLLILKRRQKGVKG